jgi:cytochrome c biogenesis protein CcmG/thiol:disulfide interchange protein DsbE
MNHDHDDGSPAHDPTSIDVPASAAGTPDEIAPKPSDEGLPSGRGRWIAAAVAALGVALFAVPFLRGPDMPASADERASLPAGAGTCSAGKGLANFNFTLKDMNGANVRLSDYKGKVVLLNFWATWCGPCKLEIPEFVEAYDQYRDRGFVILGVLSQDDPSSEDLKAFANNFSMNYPILREHEGLDSAFGPMWAIPTSFLIDRHGGICFKHMGPVSKEMLEREIKGLL